MSVNRMKSLQEDRKKSSITFFYILTCMRLLFVAILFFLTGGYTLHVRYTALMKINKKKHDPLEMDTQLLRQN